VTKQAGSSWLVREKIVITRDATWMTYQRVEKQQDSFWRVISVVQVGWATPGDASVISSATGAELGPDSLGATANVISSSTGAELDPDSLGATATLVPTSSDAELT
jgi:hypothetical protein